MATMMEAPLQRKMARMPPALLKMQKDPPKALLKKMNSRAPPAPQRDVKDRAQTDVKHRWSSLKSRGAKDYAWAVAASGDAGYVQKNAALDACVRILEYSGSHDGSRLSPKALKELGCDDDRLSMKKLLVSFRSDFMREENIFEKTVSDSVVLSKASARMAEAFAGKSSVKIEEEIKIKHMPHETERLRVVVDLFPKTPYVKRLHDAIARGDVAAVERAARDGAGSSNNKSGEVAAFATMARSLHVAAARDGAFGAPATGVLESLANLGADLLAPDASGYTPLHVAAAIGNAYAVEAILKRSENIDGLNKAASRRCLAGFTPLELAFARRKDARELFASMLCKARAFDVTFGNGPMGIKLALVRHTVSDVPLAISKMQAYEAQNENPVKPYDPKPPPPPEPSLFAKKHRRSNSQPSQESLKTHRRVKSEIRQDIHPRTLQVTAMTPTCPAAFELEEGDQLLAVNGRVVACPTEKDFSNFTAALKQTSRPLRATFVAGNYPHLSIEDDPVLHLLLPLSPPPKTDDCLL